MLNRKYLLAMGVSEREAERFFGNGAFSPTAQTALVLNLKSLDGVANRGAFVKLTADKSSTESDAIFCVQTAALMSKIHKSEKPLARIITVGDFPICIAKDGGDHCAAVGLRRMDTYGGAVCRCYPSARQAGFSTHRRNQRRSLGAFAAGA